MRHRNLSEIRDLGLPSHPYRMTAKVVPVMNSGGVLSLIHDPYDGESQTLATGAEANRLKFKALVSSLSPNEEARWMEIGRSFQRNQTVRGGSDQPDCDATGLAP